MTSKQVNGQILQNGAKYPSPFNQLLALGWYDGPTQGLLRSDGLAWKFDMVDEIHNPDGRDLRLFTLAALPVAAWERLLGVIAQYQKLSGPVWVPVWHFPAEADTKAVNRMTDEVLREAGPVEWVVAAENLLEEIVASRAVAASDLAGAVDWLAFLNVRQKSAPAH